jgi:hypothetical protein
MAVRSISIGCCRVFIESNALVRKSFDHEPITKHVKSAKRTSPNIQTLEIDPGPFFFVDVFVVSTRSGPHLWQFLFPNAVQAAQWVVAGDDRAGSGRRALRV